MQYKVIVGPTHMVIKRYHYVSEPIEIGEEHITRNSDAVREFYYLYMHEACQRYMDLLWDVNCIKWNNLRAESDEILQQHPVLYFDGPNNIVSFVPWKQARFGEYFHVPKKLRHALKKKYLQKSEKNPETLENAL